MIQRLTLLALLAMASVACKTTYPPQWVDTDVPSPSETLVYDAVHMALDRGGYPVGIGADKGARTLETGWKESLSPLKGRGYRQRAFATYAPVEDGRYEIQIRVERETNESLRAADRRYAKWEAAADNPTEAARLLQIVRSYLARDEIEIGPGRPKFGQ